MSTTMIKTSMIMMVDSCMYENNGMGREGDRGVHPKPPSALPRKKKEEEVDDRLCRAF